MTNVVYGKTEKLKKQNWCKTCEQQKKYYLKWTSKPRYMSYKTFENDLVAIWESKATLSLNKEACVGTCILHLIKVLMYEFHYDYIKNKYCNNDNLMFEIKAEDVSEILVSIKKCLILAIIVLSHIL